MFQVSYVSASTRETYSKVGRELLASIATVHPYIISVLLERLRETIKTVGMVGFFIPLKLNLHFYKVIVNGEYRFFKIDIWIIKKCAPVCSVGGSVLMQRASSKFVAADTWGDLCDRSLVVAASPGCGGEPPGLCHTRGSELGLHSGDYKCLSSDVFSAVIHLLLKMSFVSCRMAPWPCPHRSTVK